MNCDCAICGETTAPTMISASGVCWSCTRELCEPPPEDNFDNDLLAGTEY